MRAPGLTANQLATMRELYAEAERQLAESRSFEAPFRSLPAGNAHMDGLARGEGLHAYLAALGSGQTPEAALAHAKAEAAVYFAKANERAGDPAIRRWTQGADAWLESMHHRFLEA